MTHLPSTGDAAHDAWLERRPLPDAGQWHVTPKQVQVLDALAVLGMAKRVAHALGMTQNTVEAHLHTIRRRNGRLPGLTLIAAWTAYRVSTAAHSSTGTHPGGQADLPGA